MSDLSILENRFQEIMKRRLTLEIERRPPLFPWETEIVEYPTDNQSPSWLSRLALPVQLPAQVLSQLIQACSQRLDSFEPHPKKIVQVVSELFPNQLDFLNNQANIMRLAVATRSSATLIKDSSLNSDLEDYEECSLEQKMTLSLLAVEQIFKALILNLSVTKPLINQEWEIETGKILVQGTYFNSNSIPQIKVEINVPDQGEITWIYQNQTLKMNCNPSEKVTFYLTEIELEKIYSVKISLFDPAQSSLTFGLKIEEF
jgi:hypothetical protein